MEMTRCLLYKKCLSKEYWDKSGHTSVFLLNMLPTKALEGKTPFGIWYGYKPFLKYLKVFRCLYFTYVRHAERDELDKKVEAGMFVVYNTILRLTRLSNII